jgi:hypothetical protein
MNDWTASDIVSPTNDLALSELLDRALNKGIVVIGDLTLSIAGVDLIYLGVRLLLSSVETAERLRTPGETKLEADHALSVRNH